MKRVLSALLVLASASTASAVDFAWPQLNTPIPDNNVAGVSIDLVVGANIPLSVETNCVEVTLNFANVAGGALGHTWAGDIVATLTKVGDGSVTFLTKVGDTTGTGFGDSSDMRGPYTFTNKTTNSFWTAAAAIGAGNIAAGLYQGAAPLTGARVDMCLPFQASGSIGTWRLTISDRAGGDTGVISSASLSLKPEPSTLALLGLGVVALIRRRK